MRPQNDVVGFSFARPGHPLFEVHARAGPPVAISPKALGQAAGRAVGFGTMPRVGSAVVKRAEPG